MFALTGDAEAAAPIFAAAEQALGGRDARDIAAGGDANALHRNAIAQVLCCTQALAAAATLHDALQDEAS